MLKLGKMLIVTAAALLLLGGAANVCAEDLGMMTPQDALTYMKANPDLIIVDTVLPEYYEKQHFDGAINIPAVEMEERHVELPEGAKVLVHCRIGKLSMGAYKFLQQNRPDLELSYIGGAPLFEPYNEWAAKNRKPAGK